MKTHRFLGVALTLGLIFFAALGRGQAQGQYTSYQLENIHWQTMRGGWANAQQGGFQVLGAEANARGGFYHVRSLVSGCEWKFAWVFSKDGVPVDVTQISYNRGELAATFQIESSGGSCSSRDVNPFVEFHADGDPTALIYGPNEEYKGRFCLQAGGHCNQRYPYRKFKIYRQTSVKEGALFEINLFLPAYTGYGQHAQSIIYQYKGLSGDSVPSGGTWQPGSNGSIPENAYVAGNEADGTVLFIARSKYEGGQHIGKMRRDWNAAAIPYGGQEIYLKEYEVYVGKAVWVKVSGGRLPSNVLIGGREADGTPLYVARAALEGGVHIGKTRADWNAAAIPYGGKEVMVPQYEVIVIK